MSNTSQRPRLAAQVIFPISGGSPTETARIQPSMVRAMVAWIKRRAEAKRAHRLERFTAAHSSSLNRHTPGDAGFHAADHNQNWPQVIDAIQSDMMLEALKEKSRHG